MKAKTALALLPLLVGCSSASTSHETFQPPTDPPEEPAVPPTVLVTGNVGLVGVTSDRWAVYRGAEKLEAVELKAGAMPVAITDKPGSVVIRHQTVFNWANVDWTTNLGDLTVWSAKGGAHVIGTSLYAEAMIAAREDSNFVVYTQNVTETTADLVIAASDMSSQQVLIPAMGRGSAETCGATFGFVGEQLFVASCQVGSRVAKLERYEYLDGRWGPQTVTDDALPVWSADERGTRVFYQSSNYQGFVIENGASQMIDVGVGDGRMFPDGSAILYNVGDQLRRTSLPEVNPFPIVTKGYAARVEYAPKLDYVLYSNEVTYETGTRRDLYLAKTDAFNESPLTLVPEPAAGTARSSFTKDGKYVFYFTEITPNGATLNIQPVDGSEPRTLPNVTEAAAGKGSTIVFSDNQTDPEVYPVKADLRALDAASSEEPRMLEPGFIDGRSFQLDPSGYYVVYVRPGTEDAPEQRLIFQSVP